MDKKNQENMLGNMDRVMRQLRRRPEGRRHGGRGTYRILRLLSETPGLSTRQLAEIMDIRPASLNERLASLEQDKMIRRERDPNDQRVFLIYLEPPGRDLLDDAKRQRQTMYAAIEKILTSEEVREMSRLADKLANGLETLNNPQGLAASGKIRGADGQ
ncbi:MAG TPA: MarR family transcriptional regulator [Clostridiaceae bacterium]|nr:MarR family transcriptional regulator [Clostridiaceae bacterium]